MHNVSVQCIMLVYVLTILCGSKCSVMRGRTRRKWKVVFIIKSSSVPHVNGVIFETSYDAVSQWQEEHLQYNGIRNNKSLKIYIRISPAPFKIICVTSLYIKDIWAHTTCP